MSPSSKQAPSTSVQTQPATNLPLTPEQSENQAFQQDQLEATQLQIQAKHGTITPEGQERLGVLQAKMDSLLQGRVEKASRFGHTFANVAVNPAKGESVQPIQTKLAIGEPGDKYEQEADRTAAEVVSRINAPGGSLSNPSQAAVQRQEMPQEEEQLQMKPQISLLQRQEMPQEEEEIQMKPEISLLQRQEKPQEEEEIQMKSGASQHRTATPGLETSIQQAKGSGQPLSETIRQPMEQAFGVDFSGVKVHTDSQSDVLNRSINARAFTTGQDIFFRPGEYNPGSRGGQELIAHELTHVVQQNNGVQPKLDIGEQSGKSTIQRKQHQISLGGGGWTDDSFFDLKTSAKVFPLAATQKNYTLDDGEVVTIPGTDLYKGDGNGDSEGGQVVLSSDYMVERDDWGFNEVKSDKLTSTFDYQVGMDKSVLLTRAPGTPIDRARHIFKAEDGDEQEYEVYITNDLSGSSLEKINQKVALTFNRKDVNVDSTEHKKTSTSFDIGAGGSVSGKLNTKLTLQLAANGKDVFLIIGGARVAKTTIGFLQGMAAFQKILGSLAKDIEELLKKQNLEVGMTQELAAELNAKLNVSYEYLKTYEETEKVTSSFTKGGIQIEENHNIQIRQNRQAAQMEFYELENQKELSKETQTSIDALIGKYRGALQRKDTRYRICIQGSASSSGDPKYNEGLSKIRADKVRSYIMTKFKLIPEVFIMGEPLGETKANQTITDSADRNVRISIIQL
ncbi:MAG TPA: DUF4157 domain-containing protein [Coleofasciculaceae cyanobacterium]